MPEFREMIKREGQDGLKLLFADLGQLKSLALDPLPNVYEDGNGNIGIGTTVPRDNLSVQEVLSGSNATIGLYTQDADGTDSVTFSLFARGTPSDITTVRERLMLQYRAADTNFQIRTEVGGTGTVRDLEIKTGTNSNQLFLATDGNVGSGTNTPQGKLHAYDTISGFLLWEFDGLDATVRTVIPNGTGDVLYQCHVDYVLRDSAGGVASQSTDVSNGASVNIFVGAPVNTVRLRVNADGSFDVARTAGTDTIKIALTLRWL